jgi:hypothetical protein
MGPSFCTGVVLNEGRIIDEAPTLARAMGFELPAADGKTMEALLR